MRGSSARHRIRAAAAGSKAWTPLGGAGPLHDDFRHSQGWLLQLAYTEHGEIASASLGRWEPNGTPSENLAAVLRVLAEVK
ncbi:hypothetical protein [Pseudarthrobacter chlorophenolicus]|uniref:hypothetical protein n=1 Tax=Pseudarthrobacter chlorophenolicus TaxID=85085 RepID=UPI001113493F|nr:hypothetical protein [Pseudarthrobacter chlorophenolicus]